MNKDTTIAVLDKGYVRLIDYMGSDEYAIRAARMSTGKGFQGWDKDARLLAYLYKHRHMTPFEMSELVIEVKAPIFVFREWHRHRTQSYNEFSARYSVMSYEHYVPAPERIQTQHAVNKQASGGGLPEETAAAAISQITRDQQHVYENYSWMLEQGVAREVARINTPVSRYSKMWAKANLRNWLHFLQLRTDLGAQYEIRQYAEAVAQIVQALWPRTYALFEEHTRNAATFSGTEVQVLQQLVTGVITIDALPVLLGEAGHAEFLAKLAKS